MIYSADTIAKYILHYCKKNNIKDCSNKKLQKLLYYSQAWSLVFRNCRLFTNNIVAWLHGPVIEDIYHQYKSFGYLPIDIDLKDFKENSINDKAKELIDSVLEVYGKLDADYLEMRTHIEEPWIEARKSKNEIITNNMMKTYYKQVLDANGQKK